MGHVEKRGDRRWLAVYIGDDGKRHSKSFPRKLDADRYLSTMTVDVMAGRWVDPVRGEITLGQYASQWIEHRDLPGLGTRRFYRYCYRLMEPMHGVPMAELRASRITQWQTRLLDTSARSTVGQARKLLSTILLAAVRDKVIAASPLVNVPSLRARKERIVPVTADRVLELRDHMTPKLQAAVLVAAGCGLRSGELRGLTVDRVDFLRRVITVDRQLARRDGVRPVFAATKTESSVRDVPAPQAVIDALSAHLAGSPAGHDGIIFHSRDGGPIVQSTFSEAITAAKVAAWAASVGVKPVEVEWRKAQPPGHLDKWHDLRHFYASALIAGGESVKTVQARLGHASAMETLDTYAHLWPDADDTTRTVMDAALTTTVEGIASVQRQM